MKHTSFESTISLPAVSEPIGPRHGASGSAMPASSSAIAAWLAERRPAEVDRVAWSRLSALGVELDPSFDDWRMVENNPTPQVRAAALAELDPLMTPAAVPVLKRWLVELSLITSRRADDAETELLRLAAYSDRLGAYPADVAHEALLVRPWRWWPSWAELQGACAPLFGPRGTLRDALRDWPQELAEQRELARERIRQDNAAAQARRDAAAAEEAAERARAAQCMRPEGCDDCLCPEVCAAHRAGGGKTRRGSLAAGAAVDEFLRERRFS